MRLKALNKKQNKAHPSEPPQERSYPSGYGLEVVVTN
jgi:hypothetical protein